MRTVHASGTSVAVYKTFVKSISSGTIYFRALVFGEFIHSYSTVVYLESVGRKIRIDVSKGRG